MSHSLPYPAQHDPRMVHPQLALRDSLPQGGLLSPDFMASLGSVQPSVSPTSRTAQDIAAYLNGGASSVQPSHQAYGGPAQTFLQQQALIQALLASAKQTHPSQSSAYTQPSFFASANANNVNNPSPSTANGHAHAQPPLWTQEAVAAPQQPPSSAFNLAQYQAYLQFHALRFAPSLNNFAIAAPTMANQQCGQSSGPVYPALPFLGGGGATDYPTPNLTSSASSHSTAESPNPPELGQDFIYDPAYDLSGGADEFGDVSPFLQPARVVPTGFDYQKEAATQFASFQDPQFYPQQQQHYQQHQQPQTINFEADSPLTTSPSSVLSAGSPYAFNTLADGSYSASGSEQDFSLAGAPRPAAAPSSSSASVTSDTVDGDPEKKRHVCHVCHRPFARAFNLKSHMHTHAPQRFKPFNCPAVGCSRSFSRSHDMERHRSGIHQEGPLAAKAGLIPEDSPAAAPGVKASAKKRASAVRGVSAA